MRPKAEIRSDLLDHSFLKVSNKTQNDQQSKEVKDKKYIHELVSLINICMLRQLVGVHTPRKPCVKIARFNINKLLLRSYASPIPICKSSYFSKR